MNQARSVRRKRRYRKGHRNPVISKRINFGSVKNLFSGYFQSVLFYLDLNTHALHVLGYRSNPVCLFDAEFGSIFHNKSFLAGGAQN